MTNFKYAFALVFLISSLTGCLKEQKKNTDSIAKTKEELLFSTYCASCHIAPSIQALPKDIWKNAILPLMSTRMGLVNENKSLDKTILNQIEVIKNVGLHLSSPMLSNEDWGLLKNYIIALAPDTLDFSNSSNKSTELTQFKSKQIKLDNIAGSYITYLKYEPKIERLIIGNVSGNLMSYDFELENISFLRECGSGVTDHTEIKDIKYTTAVGRLDPDPSEIATGKIFIQKNGVDSFISKLHRPVNTLVKDLNNDGNDELIISEFGNLHGKLSLYSMDNTKNYKGKILLDQPGAIRTLSRDMDNDGRDDLISLVAQGDENITIFFNQGDLNFKTDKVLQFSPVYGSSWFDLIDYDGDGDEDIITVNGDNADFSYVQKPYHGLRIHINDGNNHFTEKYFYPMNGATRFVANDFDQDGDVDFGIISTFPDYEKRPEFSFVYLENTDSDSFIFDPFTMNDINSGRWLLLDSGDIDQDGDEDIILSSFTYVFSPVPKELLKLWKSNGVDLLVLENNLIN